MQVPIINGIYTDESADFRTSYPRNLVPVPKSQGISQGYLRPAWGINNFATGSGVDRGGINWNGACYRVMGTNLVMVDMFGNITTIGGVGGTGQVIFDYSFDRLAIASGGSLYYWDGVTLSQVLDPDLGIVIDMLWVDGYFMATDGTYVIVTELNDPTSVNPLKYGSSESDPDPVKGLLKLRNEVYVLNRYTIEVFENVGGTGFPFSRVEGAQLQRGAIGTNASAVFMQAIAFIGSGRNEPPAVWLGLNSQMSKISTREIDLILKSYTEKQLASVTVDVKVDGHHHHLLIHLPDRTLVYDASATVSMEQPIWFELTSSISGLGQYRARNFVWCYDHWIVGDPTTTKLGIVDDTVSNHYGDDIDWEFSTPVLYNEGNGAIVHEVELVCLSGRVPADVDPVIWSSYSNDGEVWSVERACKVGRRGERAKRVAWLQQGRMAHWRIQKFRGTSQAFITMARLEVRVEPLYA